MLAKRRLHPPILEIPSGQGPAYITLSTKIAGAIAATAIGDVKRAADLQSSNDPAPTLAEYHDHIRVVDALIPQLEKHAEIFAQVADVLLGTDPPPLERFPSTLLPVAHTAKAIHDAIALETPDAASDIEATAEQFAALAETLATEISTLKSRRDTLAKLLRQATTYALANPKGNAVKLYQMYDSDVVVPTHSPDATAIRKAALTHLNLMKDAAAQATARRRKTQRAEIQNALSDLWGNR